MKEDRSLDIIPREVALQFCAEICVKNKRRLFTQCWGCWKTSKGDPVKMCISSRPNYRGCRLVNVRYDQSFGGERKDNSIMGGEKQ